MAGAKIAYVLHGNDNGYRFWRVKYQSGKETFHRENELPETVLNFILEEDTIGHDCYGNVRYCK